MNDVAVVVIGRNEGDRLISCLDSLLSQLSDHSKIVYVDSGSTDQSCESAIERGVTVVELNLSIPFTAARARNAGFSKVLELFPHIKYVQFIDGDCELLDGWLEAASTVLLQDPKTVAVCGWRCERFPTRTVFNRICDVEWHSGNVGETPHFGGDVMIRVSALTAVEGYNDFVIAAEDDELSVRLRHQGGTIIRIDRDSTIHDANMHMVSQWFRRAIRGGYAYAQVHDLHGAPPERKFFKDVLRNWIWGALLPFLAIIAWPATHGISLLLFLRYPITALRVILNIHKQGYSWMHSLSWGISCTLSVFPGMIGVIKFHFDDFFHQPRQLIEYK